MAEPIALLELLKRIDREAFEITCCFYHNYTRGNGESIESVLKSINILVIFIVQRKQPNWAKLAKEAARTLFFFNRRLKKRAIDIIDPCWRVLPNTRQLRTILQQGDFDTLYE
ncbi:Glycosyltransferase involved in cell wall biosynthesis|nr:Glycosyltransferase involved in cell wall biosynthesis [Candidatus Pantoea persica]